MKEVKALKGFSALGHPTVISADQKRVAILVRGVLNLVDLESEKVLKTWLFDEIVYNYAFSPDGRYLAVSLVTGPTYVLRLEELPASKGERGQ